jgi:hypothetical protein
MKGNGTRTRTSILGAALAAIAFATPAVAADSITIPVSATIRGVCHFNTSPVPTLYIVNTGSGASGYIDPSIAGTATGTANLTYSCTKGQAPTVALTGGASLTLTGTGGPPLPTMVATMSLGAAPIGTGFGTAPLTVILTGTIASAIYQIADIGTYTANQVVTVNP